MYVLMIENSDSFSRVIVYRVMIINLLLSTFPSAATQGRLDAWTWRRNALGISEMVQRIAW